MTVMDMFRLDDKTAIVTGGASRFGKPISRALAQAGANVIIASVNEIKCEELAKILRGDGYSAISAQLNLADDSSINALTKKAISEFGGVDILVNNAVSRENAVELDELTREMFLASANINMAGQIAMIQSILPSMKSRGGGSIILISSVNGLGAPKFSLLGDRACPTNYVVEKWGINGLTLWLAAKYGKNNIRVNCLCPGTYDPTMHEREENEAYIKNMQAYCPLPRFMRAEEIAGPALFLSSAASSYCTGVILPVDGGYTI